jgi:hypothetical protein|nr:MAG TPA_asm: hypothetical protein [Caudoviricetes sp.]
MKKFLFLLCFILSVPCCASEISSTFKLKALHEIQNGEIKKTSGEYTKIYTIEGNTICQIASQNQHYKDLNDNNKKCFNYIYVPTLYNTGYFLVIDKGQYRNAIMQFSADFKTMTLFQFNELDTHCTIWHGITF